jgi:dephospho-CoA kinase
MTSRPWRVGLTGNVASGKSTVARVWAEAGVPVVDSDELARQAVQPGSRGLQEVVEAFGPEVLQRDGTLDRGALRARVFQDPAARKRLEGILHPRIGTLRDAWLEEQGRAGSPLVVLEIPLLFEAGLEDTVDEIVLVDAPASQRLARLEERRGLAPEEARRMMDAQMEPGLKRERSDHVLENDGTVDRLQEQAVQLLVRLGPRVEPGGA